tara:strand:+ start:43 stop:279 length:237 start_codon:yes stop_codon:yes gene_type:complete
MAYNKKPTMMEMKNAVTNLIVQYTELSESLNKLDYIIAKYINFKKDEDKFKKWLEKESLKSEKEGKNESKKVKKVKKS